MELLFAKLRVCGRIDLMKYYEEVTEALRCKKLCIAPSCPTPHISEPDGRTATSVNRTIAAITSVA